MSHQPVMPERITPNYGLANEILKSIMSIRNVVEINQRKQVVTALPELSVEDANLIKGYVEEIREYMQYINNAISNDNKEIVDMMISKKLRTQSPAIQTIGPSSIEMIRKIVKNIGLVVIRLRKQNKNLYEELGKKYLMNFSINVIKYVDEIDRQLGKINVKRN